MWLGLRVLYQHVLSRVTYFYFFYFLIFCRLYLLRENALSLVTYCGFCSGICIFIFFLFLWCRLQLLRELFLSTAYSHII